MFDISEPIVTLLGVPQQFDGASDLSAESVFSSDANLTALAESDLVAESALTADGILVLFAAAAMSAQSSLVVTETIVNLAASIVIATSDLVAESTNVREAIPSPFTADGNLVATLFIGAPVAARPIVASSNLTATVYTPSNYLVLPTIEVAYTDNILLKRYPIDNGQTLLITDNVGTLVTFAAQQDIANADYYFRGGSTNILDDEALASVQAAGYGEYVVTQ
jgi:hypothetical protein